MSVVEVLTAQASERLDDLLGICAKWEISASVIGTVTGVDHELAFGDPEGGASLWCLAVDPQSAAPGVGEALVRVLSERYIGRGRAHLDLSVMHDNAPAIRLYKKLGFRRVPVFAVKRKNVINEPLFVPEPEPDVAELNPYARIIADEARRRGITVDVLDSEWGEMRLVHGGRRAATPPAGHRFDGRCLRADESGTVGHERIERRIRGLVVSLLLRSDCAMPAFPDSTSRAVTALAVAGGALAAAAWAGRRAGPGDGGFQGRCVVITIDPVTTERNPAILRTVARDREGCLGVYGSTVEPGRIAVNDAVAIESAFLQQLRGIAVIDEAVGQTQQQHRPFNSNGGKRLDAGAARAPHHRCG